MITMENEGFDLVRGVSWNRVEKEWEGDSTPNE